MVTTGWGWRGRAVGCGRVCQKGKHFRFISTYSIDGGRFGVGDEWREDVLKSIFYENQGGLLSLNHRPYLQGLGLKPSSKVRFNPGSTTFVSCT